MSVVVFGAVDAEDNTRPSPSIWNRLDLFGIAADPAKGYDMFIDFVKEGAPGLTTVAGYPLYPYIDSGCTLTLADDPKGALAMTMDGTDGDSATVVSGNNTTGLVLPVSGSSKKWAFEARIKASQIATTVQGFFVGLTEEGQAADSKPMADTTLVMNDIDHIGFHIGAVATDQLDFTYTKSGQVDGGTSDVHTIVADAYVRLGFLYTPDDNKVHVFVNGVENKPAAVLISAANFPLDNLGICISNKTGAGAAASVLTIDWMRVAVEY
jgi:hypothetical protein